MPSGSVTPGNPTVTRPSWACARCQRTSVKKPPTAKISDTAYTIRRAGESFIVNAVKNRRSCTAARRCHGRPSSSLGSMWRAKNS